MSHPGQSRPGTYVACTSVGSSIWVFVHARVGILSVLLKVWIELWSTQRTPTLGTFGIASETCTLSTHTLSSEFDRGPNTSPCSCDPDLAGISKGKILWLSLQKRAWAHEIERIRDSNRWSVVSEVVSYY